MHYTLALRDLSTVLATPDHAAWSELARAVHKFAAPKCRYAARRGCPNVLVDDVVSHALDIQAFRTGFDPHHFLGDDASAADLGSVNCFPGMVAYAIGHARRYLRGQCSAQFRRRRAMPTSLLDIHADERPHAGDASALGVALDVLPAGIERKLRRLRLLIKDDAIPRWVAIGYAEYAGCFTRDATAEPTPGHESPTRLELDAFLDHLVQTVAVAFEASLPPAALHGRAHRAVVPVVVGLHSRKSVAEALGLTESAVHSAVKRHRPRLQKLDWPTLIASAIASLRTPHRQGEAEATSGPG